jgi:hypothetical protein
VNSTHQIGKVRYQQSYRASYYFVLRVAKNARGPLVKECDAQVRAQRDNAVELRLSQSPEPHLPFEQAFFRDSAPLPYHLQFLELSSQLCQLTGQLLEISLALLH